jgi:hypothetical protein
VTYQPPEQPGQQPPPAPSGPPLPAPPPYYGEPSAGPQDAGPQYAGPQYAGPQYAGPQYAGPQPPKKSKAVYWVVGAVVATLLLCAGGATAVVFAIKRSADRIAAQSEYDPFERPLPEVGSSSVPPFDPDSDETGDPAPELLKIGETLVMTSEAGDQLEVTVRKQKFRKTPCGAYGQKPKNGGYLIADVSVKVTKGKGDVSPYDFEFLTPDDYSMDNTAGGGSYCGNDIASIRGLKAGGKRSGQVVFDVPSAKGEIIFKSPLGAVAGSWKVG